MQTSNPITGAVWGFFSRQIMDAAVEGSRSLRCAEESSMITMMPWLREWNGEFPLEP